MTAPRALRLNADDNVLIAVEEFPQGSAPQGVTARERVPRGHKMASAAIAEGEPIRKFGQIIGFACTPIAPGEWVHEHNCVLHDFQRDYRFGEDARPVECAAGRSSRRPSRATGAPTARPARATISASSPR